MIFDTKIMALLVELEKMKQTHPLEKSLVFSQFAPSLATMKKSLTEKGIQWRSISGDMTADARQKQIDLFNNDPPGAVFLLSLRTGAVGLTLTSATHVFIMDPAMNPALEQQAKNRVYRMGQTKDVFIKRFLMRGTVEENIEALQRTRTASDGEQASSRKQLRLNELRVWLCFAAGCLACALSLFVLYCFRLCLDFRPFLLLLVVVSVVFLDMTNCIRCFMAIIRVLMMATIHIEDELLF
jgi:hypothetical protein